MSTTLTELMAIKAEAHIGVIWKWITPFNMPAAKGMHTRLYMNAQKRFW